MKIKKSHPVFRVGFFLCLTSRVSHLGDCNSFFECVEVDFLTAVGFNVAFGNAEEDAVERFNVGCCVCYGGVECVEGDKAATTASVSTGVERDLIDPRGEFVGVAQTPHAFVRANKGLLTQIARVVSIARIAQDKVVDRALPAFDEGIKGRDLPGSELGDQFRIVHTVDLFWRFM